MSSVSSSHNKSQSGGVLSHRKSLAHEHEHKHDPSPEAAHTEEAAHSRASTPSSFFNFNMSSLLPRVNGYKRVDADSERRGRIRFAFGWKKFAIAATVIITLVWLFGPRERREAVIDSIKAPSWPKPTRPLGETIASPPEDLENDEPLPPKTSPSTPHSPAEDPDPLKTVHCVRPYKPDARLVQYALMIDAGSTGSRIHIYKFNNCGPSPSYEYEVFKMKQGGLSNYKGDPAGAAQSLDELLDEAVAVVPQSLWSCTPVAVKATAGLRLLGADQSAEILAAVRKRLETQYPFAVVEKDGVAIMDGSDEGVYAWITANYLLDTIRAHSPRSAHSFAVLDLGGGSTQIVFEPDFSDDSAMADGDHKYELQFGGSARTLYQHSFLGYGLMSARASVHRLVEFMGTFNNAPSANSTTPNMQVPNPCLWQSSSREIALEDFPSSGTTHNVTMAGMDIGSFEACNRVVELVMAKDAVCQVKPCSFNGVYQPSILESFAQGDVLLLSYFYDRIAPFYPSLSPSSSGPPQGSEGPPPSLTVSTLASLARPVCAGPEAWAREPWGADAALRTELLGRPEWCLDLTFMHALLRLGYEFPETRGIRVGKQVDGTELGWCLGAAIAIVGGELTCRV